ncbi:MAG: transcription termination/antitermination protein NusG [Acidimicrobiia bacterium]
MTVDDDLNPDNDAPAAGDIAAPATASTDTTDELPEWARVSESSVVEEEIDIDVLLVDGASGDDAEEIIEIIEVLEVAEPSLADAELLDVAEIDDEEPEAPREPSPYDQPGDWFVVHTYAGYENKVKQNLASRVRSMNVEEQIFELTIPMEDVIEFKGGRKVVVQKKLYPGYLLVRMALDDDSWYVVRNTPGVTGFVGNGARPTPLSRKEVESILGVGGKEEPGTEKKVRPRLEFEMGEQVRVTQGPFADFNGAISDIDVARSKLTVLVNIFGRETPVELELGQVAKL